MTRILLDYDNNSTSTSYFYFLWHVKKWAAAEKSHLRSVTVIVRSPEIRLLEIRTLNTALKPDKLKKKKITLKVSFESRSIRKISKEIIFLQAKTTTLPILHFFSHFRAMWYDIVLQISLTSNPEEDSKVVPNWVMAPDVSSPVPPLFIGKLHMTFLDCQNFVQ